MTEPVSYFLPILLLLILSAIVGAAILVVSGWILPGLMKPDNPKGHKLTPYECGAPPLQAGARHRYSVKFYLVAMLFILFDVEAAFLLPWAVQYKAHLWTFWAGVSFVGTLLVGYVYAWGKGALDWER
ncbi:NADH-quinone oxidoreductase subunit A [Geothrix sp. 21YS21S-2]|uniref:NADH-quinone oxidoreductase subunit A n=1 Tax=Geothrix sp. 21YS21S-2 TaxID=3068893 RepID=UPI0027BAD6C9|nr:NADH-quinone oxidoreductase subunit A [Geothrix sp. 21YS21S-2]